MGFIARVFRVYERPLNVYRGSGFRVLGFRVWKGSRFRVCEGCGFIRVCKGSGFGV